MLHAEGLRKRFRTPGGHVTPLDGVGLEVPGGVRLGLIGPSGCGKSTLAATLALLQEPDAGTVCLGGRPVTRFGLRLPPATRRRVQLLWQSPRVAADPRQRLRALIGEPERLAGGDADAAVSVWGSRTGVREELLDRHPHEVSEGQLQRACTARALSCRPDVLIADEPTSMLDVSSQAAILHTVAEEQRRTGMGVLLITHDRTLAHHWCDEVLDFDDLRVPPAERRPRPRT